MQLHGVNVNRLFFVGGATVLVYIFVFSCYKTQLEQINIVYNININGSQVIIAENSEKGGTFCKLNYPDPYDPSILQFIDYIGDLKCGRRMAPLVEYEENNLKVRHKVWRTYYQRKHGNFSKCKYRTIKRFPRKDRRVLVSKKAISFHDSVKVTGEFFKVNCKNATNARVYTEYIPVIQVKPEVEKRCKNSGDGKLNVVMVGIDSLSRSNFIRQLKRTHAYLTNEMGALDFRGYNKVAENTVVNVVPLLTGHFLEEVWNYSSDSLPLIWKNFSKEGYRTLYAEDHPKLAGFNYKRKGFIKKKPTDYYLRPFNLAVEKSEMMNKSRTFCFNSKPEAQVVLDWVRDFIHTFKDKKHFAFVFTTRLTHGYANDAGYADKIHFDFFRKTKHLYNETLLILFGDHGVRYGELRNTYVGRLEDRLPAFYVVVPEWFKKKHVEMWENLVTNQERLVTPFDVFETLKDVLYFDESSVVRKFDGSSRGISLFSKVPVTRTCDQAGISVHYCACQNFYPVSKTDFQVNLAVRAFVKFLNNKTEDYRHLCSHLEVEQIVDARISESSSNVTEEGTKDFMVTIRTRPGFGLFEGTVRLYNSTNELYEVREFNRISKYASHGWCVTGGAEVICYCRENSLDKSPP